MKALKNILAILLTLLLITWTYPAATAQQIDNGINGFTEVYETVAAKQISAASVSDSAAAKDGQVIIKLKSGCKLDWQGQGLKLLDTPASAKKRGIYLATVAPGRDVASEVRRLASLPEVEYVQPNYAYKADIQPNDELYAQQWGLDKIDVPEAWNITQGSPSVEVAVLDTGVDASHPDLKERVLNGYDFANGDDDPSDDNGHGTMVAGVIAAVANNGIGIAGVDKKCKILPVKVAGADGNFYSSDIINGIYYAVDRGADVINMSFGGQTDAAYDQAIADALWDAYNAGIVLVAASGNDSGAVSFPAALPPVISVGATDKNDNIAEFSNYGPELNLVAPGVDIYTTYSDGVKEGYASASGTSMAAPLVSGIAALLLAEKPDLKPRQVEWLMEHSAFMPAAASGQQWDVHYGYGRVDAYKALLQTLPDMSQDAADIPEEAQPINFVQPYTQRMDMPMDGDWLRLDVTDGGYVTVDVDVPQNLDIACGVYSYAGDVIQLQKAVNDGGVGQDEHFQFYADAGSYYLFIMDMNGHWSDTPYTLEISDSAHSAAVGQRLAGADRYAAAVAISQAGWPDGSACAVLASGENFPDAMAGSALAKTVDAPLLLTERNALNDYTKEELARLKVETVYILGMEGAISQTVEDELEGAGYIVKRIGGKDRYETAVSIAQAIKGLGGSMDKVILARADDYADAVAAAASGYPILFAGNAGSKALNAVTKAALIDMGISDVVIAGQSGAVSAQIEAELKDMGANVKRVGGADRYLTSLALAEEFAPAGGYAGAAIATGRNYPDALAAGPFAAENGYALFLVDNSFDSAVIDYIKGNSSIKATNVLAIGGSSAVPDAVLNAAVQAAEESGIAAAIR